MIATGGSRATTVNVLWKTVRPPRTASTACVPGSIGSSVPRAERSRGAPSNVSAIGSRSPARASVTITRGTRGASPSARFVASWRSDSSPERCARAAASRNADQALAVLPSCSSQSPSRRRTPVPGSSRWVSAHFGPASAYRRSCMSAVPSASSISAAFFSAGGAACAAPPKPSTAAVVAATRER